MNKTYILIVLAIVVFVLAGCLYFVLFKQDVYKISNNNRVVLNNGTTVQNKGETISKTENIAQDKVILSDSQKAGEAAAATSTESGVKNENQITDPKENKAVLERMAKFLVKGTASDRVNRIGITATYDNCDTRSAYLPGKKISDGKWQAEATNIIDNSDLLICGGRNKYEIKFYHDNGSAEYEVSLGKWQLLGTQVFEFVSVTGYRDPRIAKIEPYVFKKNISVADDESIKTVFDLGESCKDNQLSFSDESKEEEFYAKGYDFTDYVKIKNSENLYAKVRASVKGQDENIIGIGGWGDDHLNFSGAHVLEFYYKQGEDFVLAPIPAVNGYECMFPGDFEVYYYSADRIVAVVTGGHESTPSNLIYDGKKWNDLGDIVKKSLLMGESDYLAPLSMAGSKEHISLTEFRYCCDTTFWLYPAKTAEIIIDPKTIQLAGIKLIPRGN